MRNLEVLEPLIPVRIIGHGLALGADTTTTEQISNELLIRGADPDKASVEAIVKGIGRSLLPRASKDQTTESLAIDSAEKAIAESGIDRKSIGLVVLATSTASYQVPAGAKAVHNGLGLKGGDAFDLGDACEGYVKALEFAAAYISKYPNTDTALVIGADVVSRKLNLSDADTYPIFSDLAASTIVQYDPSSDSGILFAGRDTDGSTRMNFIMAHGADEKIAMDGSSTARTILNLLPNAINEAIRFGDPSLSLPVGKQIPKDVKVFLSSIDRVIPHLSSDRMVEIAIKILQRYGIDKSIVANNFDKLGNASAATTPANLVTEINAGRIRRGDIVAFLAAAVGSSATFTVIRY